MKRLLYTILVLSAFTACSNNKGATQTESSEIKAEEKISEVTTMPLKYTTFMHNIVSNGKVTAAQMADINFEASGTISRIYVNNGSIVAKGQRIAELQSYKLHNATERARYNMEQARIELKDVLIGQGYNPDKLNQVPADVMKLAETKSGYKSSKAQYELAKFEESQAVLVAPFSGVVANMTSKANSAVDLTKPFCRIINNQRMDVVFSIMESELPLVKIGDEVEVTAFVGDKVSAKGRICEINPLVDANGQVNVKARLVSQSKFFDGMNVKICIKQSLGRQLVIPKSSVVLRSGRQVVFCLNKGKAYWHYVHTSLENIDSYTVDERLEDGGDGLAVGDTVIVTGNVNLAHDSEVKVVGEYKQ